MGLQGRFSTEKQALRHVEQYMDKLAQDYEPSDEVIHIELRPLQERMSRALAKLSEWRIALLTVMKREPAATPESLRQGEEAPA